MTSSKHTTSATFRRIVSEPDLATHSFCAGFLRHAHAFVLWSWLDNHHQHRLTLAEATARMATLTGFGPAYSGALVRQALGVLWDIEANGRLHIRYPGTLRQQAAQVLGVRKSSRFSIPGDVLSGDLETLHAFLALPAMAGESGTTSRRYTAGIMGVTIDTVSRWRAILRARGFLVTAPNFLRLGHVAVAKGGRAMPRPAGRNVFQWGRYFYRRGPDLVTILRPKRNDSKKTSLRSVEKKTLREGARQRDAGRETALDTANCELKADRFDGLAHGCVDLLASYPDPEDGPPDQYSGSGTLASAQVAWEHDLRTQCDQWGLLSESRLAAVTDAVSGALDYPAARKAILSESIRYRQLRDTWRERSWAAQGRELRAQNAECL